MTFYVPKIKSKEHFLIWLTYEMLLKIQSNPALFWFQRDQWCYVFGQLLLALLGIEHMLNPSLMKIRKIVKLRMSKTRTKEISQETRIPCIEIVAFFSIKRCQSWVNWTTHFTCDLKKSLTLLYFRVCAFFPTWTTTLISFCFRNTFLGLGHGSFGISRVAFDKLSWFFSALKI